MCGVQSGSRNNLLITSRVSPPQVLKLRNQEELCCRSLVLDKTSTTTTHECAQFLCFEKQLAMLAIAELLSRKSIRSHHYGCGRRVHLALLTEASEVQQLKRLHLEAPRRGVSLLRSSKLGSRRPEATNERWLAREGRRTERNRKVTQSSPSAQSLSHRSVCRTHRVILG